MQYENIGPLNPRFNLEVAQYISHSPPYVQTRCLADFFQALKTGEVRVPCKRFNENYILVSVCGCIIHFTNGGLRVDRIEPGVL